MFSRGKNVMETAQFVLIRKSFYWGYLRILLVNLARAVESVMFHSSKYNEKLKTIAKCVH